MFKNLSLRLQLTILTTATMFVLALILTASSVSNVNLNFVLPIDQIISSGLISESNPSNSLVISGETTDIESVIMIGNQNFIASSLISMSLVIITGGVVIYFVLGKALKPVQSLSHDVAQINVNDLSYRIHESDSYAEINQLTTSFNELLERVEKAFASQKRFSSNAAHELKTPLTVLKTNLDVLNLSQDTTLEEYQQLYKVTQRQTDRMIQLVDDLFSLSTQDDIQLNEIINLDTLMKSIINDLTYLSKQKNQIIKYSLSPITTIGNKELLTRAFSNLIENAIKYTEAGGTISILTITNNQLITIKVTDTGVGIPPQEVENIFKPFYRIDHSRSRKVGGAGLGLAITSEIIKSHHGIITYSENVPKGSIFTVTLPL